MKIFRSLLVFFIFTALFLSSSFSYGQIEEEFTKRSGPITMRNQMPLYLFYLQMAPDVAGVTDRGKFRINADYTVSNITVSTFTPVSSLYLIDIDLEVSRLTLDFRYGVYDNFEVGLEIPYLSLSRGYLDNFIEGIEDGLGARTPRSRERQGSYEFDYSFRYNSKYLIQESHSKEGLGDISLSAKWRLFKEKGFFLPNISLRSAIKFPTAEKKDLIGSGEIDYGLGLLLDKGFFDRFFIYAGANIVKIEKPSFFSELGLEEYIYSGMLAGEYFFTKRFSFVAQVTGNSTPYPESQTNVLDNQAYELGLGFNYKCKEKSGSLWHFAFTENIKSASTPDVSFHTGLDWKF